MPGPLYRYLFTSPRIYSFLWPRAADLPDDVIVDCGGAGAGGNDGIHNGGVGGGGGAWAAAIFNPIAGRIYKISVGQGGRGAKSTPSYVPAGVAGNSYLSDSVTLAIICLADCGHAGDGTGGLVELCTGQFSRPGGNGCNPAGDVNYGGGGGSGGGAGANGVAGGNPVPFLPYPGGRLRGPLGYVGNGGNGERIDLILHVTIPPAAGHRGGYENTALGFLENPALAKRGVATGGGGGGGGLVTGGTGNASDGGKGVVYMEYIGTANSGLSRYNRTFRDPIGAPVRSGVIP